MNKSKNQPRQPLFSASKVIEYGLPLLLLIPIYMYLRAIG